MALGAILGVVGALGGLFQGNKAAKAAEKAAEAQAAASREQLALQTRMYDEGVNRLAPYLRSGTRAQRAYGAELGLNAAPKGYDEYEMGRFRADPGYKFRVAQGLDAVQSSAAARGGLYSGNAMQGVNDYGQGMASQEYGNWYQRAYGAEQDHLNRLAGIAGNGQNAATGQASLGANYANSAGTAIANQGNAQAAGAVGSANAWNAGIDNAISSLGYLSSLQRTGTTQNAPRNQLGGYSYSPWG
jgi:hypothetical protein